MKELYSPSNEVELTVLRSILDGAGIRYFVKNDNFGSIEIIPIPIINYTQKKIFVGEDQFEDAEAIVTDYLKRIRSDAEVPEEMEPGDSEPDKEDQ